MRTDPTFKHALLFIRIITLKSWNNNLVSICGGFLDNDFCFPTHPPPPALLCDVKILQYSLAPNGWSWSPYVYLTLVGISKATPDVCLAPMDSRVRLSLTQTIPAYECSPFWLWNYLFGSKCHIPMLQSPVWVGGKNLYLRVLWRVGCWLGFRWKEAIKIIHSIAQFSPSLLYSIYQAMAKNIKTWVKSVHLGNTGINVVGGWGLNYLVFGSALLWNIQILVVVFHW